MTTDFPVLAALDSRKDLAPYAPNSLALFALEMRFGIEDIVAEAVDCLIT